ncbi:hypothetical protein V6N13_092874 [Hibiscus sabdariffa]
MKGVTSRHTTWVEVVINNGMHREYGDNHSVQVLDMDSGAVRPDPPSLDPFLTSEHNASVLDLGVDSNSWRQVPSWVESIDKLNTTHCHSQDLENNQLSTFEEEKLESSESCLANSQILVRSSKKRGSKKFGSLKEIQDMVLIGAERKKRDRALRNLKKKWKIRAMLELMKL